MEQKEIQQQPNGLNYFERVLPAEIKEQWYVDKLLQRHAIIPEFSEDEELAAVTMIPARGEELHAYNISRRDGRIMVLPFTYVERDELYPDLSTKHEFEHLMRNMLSVYPRTEWRQYMTPILNMRFVVAPEPVEKRNFAATERILKLCQSPAGSYETIEHEAASAQHRQLRGLLALL